MLKKLKNRILLGYSVPLLLSLLMAVVVYPNVAIAQQSVTTAITEREIVAAADSMALAVANIQGEAASFILVPDAASEEKFEEGIKRYKKSVENLYARLQNREQRIKLNKIIALGDRISGATQNWISLVQSDRREAALKDFATNETQAMTELLTEMLDSFANKEDELQRAKEQKSKKTLELLLWFLIVGSLVAIIFALGVGYLVASRIAQTIAEIVDTQASSSREIAAAVEEQERTTAAQSSSINQTTVTIEELSAASSEAANQAEAAAFKAKEVLALLDSTRGEGGDRSTQMTGQISLGQLSENVGTLKETMQAISQQVRRLSQQTNQIANISDLVSELAGQTNMLSLNAAVEAVRAGEHGKGFGVVASEIRKLAEQSKQAAKKIGDIVAEIQMATNASVEVTAAGTKTVDKIVLAMDEVALNNQQSSLSARQQLTAIQQIATSMNELTQAAAQIATGIAQCKTSTQQLKSVAQELQSMV